MTIMIPAWENGELQPVEKLDAHVRGLKHKAVSIFVMNRGRVLIQQRAMDKYHTPGLWANTCCTHPVWDEADAACALRRLREEFGFVGTPIRINLRIRELMKKREQAYLQAGIAVFTDGRSLQQLCVIVERVYEREVRAALKGPGKRRD
mgnify:CR=1 FL=1